MGADIYVSFGASTGDLEAGAAVATAVVRANVAELRQLAAQYAATGAAADSELGQKLRQVGADLSASKEAAAAVKTEMSTVGAALGDAGEVIAHGGAGIGFWTRELRAAGDELSSGRYHQAAGTLLNLGVHFVEMAPQIAAWSAALAVAGGVAAYFVTQAIEVANSLQAIKEALAVSANAGILDPKVLEEAAAQLRELKGVFSGLGEGDIRQIVAGFAQMKDASDVAIKAMSEDASQFWTLFASKGKSAEDKEKEWAATLTELFSNPFQAIDNIADKLRGLTEAQREQLKVAQDSLEPLTAQAAIQAIIAEKARSESQVRITDIDAQIEKLEELQAQEQKSGASFDATIAGGMIAQLEAQRTALVAINAEASRLPSLLAAATSPAATLRERFDDVLKAIAPWAAELEKAQQAVGVLSQGLAGATGDAATLIAKFESFSASAYKDNDGRYRVGYGSDTTTSASGQISQVVAETTTTVADAQRDLARRIVEFQTDAAAAIGPAWEGLSEKAKASLTSLFYNYGDNKSALAGVITAAQSGNEKSIADAIAARSGDNGGTNAGRRAQEAANITRPDAAVTDPAKVAEGNEALAEQKDKILQIQQAKSGGSAIDQAALANLQAEAAGKKDEIAAQQRVVNGIQDQLNLVSSVEEKTKLQQQLLQAQASLQDKENASVEAGMHLKVAAAQGSGDIGAQHAAAVELAQFKMSLYAEDTAQYKSAEGEKAAADRTYADQQRQVAMTAAQDEVSRLKTATAQKIQEYQTEEKAKQITEAQKVALTTAALQQETQQATATLQKELALDGLRVEERKKILDQIAALEQANAGKVVQLQTQQAADVAKQWQGAVNTIEQSWNSQLRGLIQGTTSWSDAWKSIVMGMLVDFIEMCEKMVTQWIMSTAIMKAVEAAFNVLLPGSGSALASFDVGSWSVPHDMVAKVHQGEMIVPARNGAADSFREMMGGGAGGSAPGRGPPGPSAAVRRGGDTHVHINATDSQTVASMLMGNGRAGLKAIAQAVRHGEHLGLKGFPR